MERPRGTDAALLLFTAACLFFGGGFGCEEEVDGVQFKVTSFDGELYMGITGKAEPGEGSLRLPYNLEPPFFGKIEAGIFDPDFLALTADAAAYAQLERADLAEGYRIDLRYELSPAVGLRISSNIDATTAFCAGASRARVRIDDDGADALLRYRCPGATSWSDLTSLASLYDDGEPWYFRVGAVALPRRAQIGFNNYRFGSGTPVSPTPERAASFATLDLFRFSLNAWYHLADDELLDAQADANTAFGALVTARNLTDPEFGIADFPGTGVGKALIKLDKSYFKLYQGKFEGKEESYLKKYPKLTWGLASVLAEMDAFD